MTTQPNFLLDPLDLIRLRKNSWSPNFRHCHLRHFRKSPCLQHWLIPTASYWPGTYLRHFWMPDRWAMSHWICTVQWLKRLAGHLGSFAMPTTPLQWRDPRRLLAGQRGIFQNSRRLRGMRSRIRQCFSCMVRTGERCMWRYKWLFEIILTIQ